MTDEANRGVIADTLYVGATRPAMKFGVTYTAMMINFIVTMEAFVLTQNLLWLGLFAPFHGIFYLICKNDPQTFDLLKLWAMTKGWNTVIGRVLNQSNYSLWKSSSYTPLPIAVGRRLKKLKPKDTESLERGFQRLANNVRAMQPSSPVRLAPLPSRSPSRSSEQVFTSAPVNEARRIA